MWQLVVLCNEILIKVVGFPIKLYRNEKEYLCNLYYFLGIVVVALLFTIATLQSDLRNVVRNQANQMIDTTTML